jgi:hypothetical protein
MDAKVATADMANRLMVWAAFGKPNQREWVPGQYSNYAKNDGLYSSGYYLFDGSAPAPPGTPARDTERKEPPKPVSYEWRLWKGWVLPASDEDTWFVAGSAAYHRLLSSPDPEKGLEATRITLRGLRLSPQNDMNRHAMEQAKGVLYLDWLRRHKGDDAFFKLMSEYFAANTTNTVTAKSFLDQALTGHLRAESVDEVSPDGPAYLTTDINRRLESAVIVYGTNRDAGANRYAAEQMQSRFLDQFESRVPIFKDFDTSDDSLRHSDVIFIGRPEANSALKAWAAKIGLKYSGAAFEIDGATHASEREALLYAAKNPLDAAHMVLVVAGNDALRTVKAFRAQISTPFAIFKDGDPIAPADRPRR